MLFSITSARLEVEPHSVGFRATCESGRSIDCKISLDALLDLSGYHRARGTAEELFRAVHPEIERLLGAKYRRVEADIEFRIGCADLLLYGFEQRKEPPKGLFASAAQV